MATRSVNPDEHIKCIDPTKVCLTISVQGFYLPSLKSRHILGGSNASQGYVVKQLAWASMNQQDNGWFRFASPVPSTSPFLSRIDCIGIRETQKMVGISYDDDVMSENLKIPLDELPNIITTLVQKYGSKEKPAIAVGDYWSCVAVRGQTFKGITTNTPVYYINEEYGGPDLFELRGTAKEQFTHLTENQLSPCNLHFEGHVFDKPPWKPQDLPLAFYTNCCKVDAVLLAALLQKQITGIRRVEELDLDKLKVN